LDPYCSSPSMSTQGETEASEETKEESKEQRYQLKLLPVTELKQFSTLQQHTEAEEDSHSWEYDHQTGQCKDILISNEFCQIAIGDDLIQPQADGELLLEEETDEIAKEAVVYLDQVTTGNPQRIAFEPGSGDFTLTAEIFAVNDWGSRVFSNRLSGCGFELVVPRYKARLLSVFLDGEHDNVGKTVLQYHKWYHVAVTVKRDVAANSTVVKTYLNGHLDGEVDFPGVSTTTTGDGTGLIGSIGSDPNGTDTDHIFEGKIKNVRVWYESLTDTKVSQLAEGYEYVSDITEEEKMDDALTFGFVPSSVRVEVPTADYVYNGPIDVRLDHDFQPGAGAFTITAMIIPTRAWGSRVLSTRHDGGFEMVVPRYGSHVFSVWTADGHVDIGEQKLAIKKRMYHVAVTVNRIVSSGAHRTVISGYVNGKKDGGHVFYNLRDLNGGETWIGSRMGTADKFDGSINNLRIYYRCLASTEIATIYAADVRDCLLLNAEQSSAATAASAPAQSTNSTTLEAPMTVPSPVNTRGFQFYLTDLKKWIDVDKVHSIDYERACAEISYTFGNSTLGTERLSVPAQLIKRRQLLQYIPGSDALKVSNIGGCIVGRDFDDKTWKLRVKSGDVAAHLMRQNSLKSLTEMKPFPKHSFLGVLSKYDKNKVGIKLVLNRLLVSADIILNDVNTDKQHWKYFNEYILPWQLWDQRSENGFQAGLQRVMQMNFAKLQAVARQLQKPFTAMQFALFDNLKSNKETVAKIWSVANMSHDSIVCRQDGFDSGLTCECPFEAPESAEYDRQVCSKNLWGRCLIVNEQFQKDIERLYMNDKRFSFHRGPPKTYERMVEKVIEYTDEGADYPRAFKICDVLRNSINCQSLNDIYDAFKILKNNFVVVRVKNRFAKDYDATLSMGYRDLLVNVLYEHTAYKLKVICEIQFHLQGFLDIKKKQHKLYKIIRANSYKTLLQNYEARKFDA